MNRTDLDNHITGHYGEDQWVTDSDIRERMLVATMRRIRSIAQDGGLPAAKACMQIIDAVEWQLKDLDYEV